MWPDVSSNWPPEGSSKGRVQWLWGAGCPQPQLCCPAHCSLLSHKHKSLQAHLSCPLLGTSWGIKGLIKPRCILLVMQCHGTCPGREHLAFLHMAGVEMACVSPCESPCSAFHVPFTTLVWTALLQESFDFTSVQLLYLSPVIKKCSKPIMAKIGSPSEQGCTSPPSPHEAATSSPNSPLTSPTWLLCQLLWSHSHITFLCPNKPPDSNEEDCHL